MLSAIGEDRKQLENRTRLLHDTLSRKIFPWVANEEAETDWDDLLHSFALASKQLDDLSVDLKSVYSMQVPAPKKPMPPGQHSIPQILSTIVDKSDASKIVMKPPALGSINNDKDMRRATDHNASMDRVLFKFNDAASS
jgi:hypothetical protein